jgi:hypothetical protein
LILFTLVFKANTNEETIEAGQKMLHKLDLDSPPCHHGAKKPVRKRRTEPPKKLAELCEIMNFNTLPS